jgi:hypothetical protein
MLLALSVAPPKQKRSVPNVEHRMSGLKNWKR